MSRNFSCVQKLNAKFIYQIHPVERLSSQKTRILHTSDREDFVFIFVCAEDGWLCCELGRVSHEFIIVLMHVEMLQSSMNSPQSTPPFFLPDIGVETTHATMHHLLATTTIYQYRLSSNWEENLNLVLGNWVKACSTAWLSQFVLTKFDNTCWIQYFRMSKDIVSRICQDL